MRSFEAGQIYLPVDQITLQSAVELGVFRGRQTLHAQQTPQVLESLRQTAIIQSTESSNRIEGVEAPQERIQELVQQKTTPKNRLISLEKTIEKTRETYHETLNASSQGWYDGNHDLAPWLHYLLGTFIASYREFESRVGMLSTVRGAKTEVVRDAFRRIDSPFRMKELEALCPTVSRDMIRVVLNELKDEGRVRAQGKGVAAKWIKSNAGS